jgi:hypothetical protein
MVASRLFSLIILLLVCAALFSAGQALGASGSSGQATQEVLFTLETHTGPAASEATASVSCAMRLHAQHTPDEFGGTWVYFQGETICTAPLTMQGQATLWVEAPPSGGPWEYGEMYSGTFDYAESSNQSLLPPAQPYWAQYVFEIWAPPGKAGKAAPGCWGAGTPLLQCDWVTGGST